MIYEVSTRTIVSFKEVCGIDLPVRYRSLHWDESNVPLTLWLECEKPSQ